MTNRGWRTVKREYRRIKHTLNDKHHHADGAKADPHAHHHDVSRKPTPLFYVMWIYGGETVKARAFSCISKAGTTESAIASCVIGRT